MRVNRTKIVCTVGPASGTKEVLLRMIESGMDVVRVNFSHGTHPEKKILIENIRAASRESGVRIPIMQDLSGPKLRVGKFPGGQLVLMTGALVNVSAREDSGDVGGIVLSHPEVLNAMKSRDRILLGDGEMELEVATVGNGTAECRVVAGGILKSNKGFCVPDLKPDLTLPTAKDLEDLSFGIANGVDLVAMSFVRTVEDIRALRQAMKDRNGSAGIVAKIERRDACENLDSILGECDGVMVARGDLGLELPLSEVPMVQKEIIRKANRAGVPVITATQMLESMTTSPRPTRAEVSDVANAVLDGTDAVMLSGETAVGSYPVETVNMMDEIIAATEKTLDYRGLFSARTLNPGPSPADAVARAACQAALDSNAAAIICCTRTGNTARLVAKYRPRAVVVAAGPDEAALVRTALVWGVAVVLVATAADESAIVAGAKRAVIDAGFAKPGDRVVAIFGGGTVRLDTL